MVRTKADNCASSRKVVAAQAPRKSLSGAGSSFSSSENSPAGKGKYAGGNPVCARPTPDWQKGINAFFTKSQAFSSSSSSLSTSSSQESIQSSSSSSES